MVVHQTRTPMNTRPNATEETNNLPRRTITIAPAPMMANATAARPLFHSGIGRRYHSASAAHALSAMMSKDKAAMNRIEARRRN